MRPVHSTALIIQTNFVQASIQVCLPSQLKKGDKIQIRNKVLGERLSHQGLFELSEVKALNVSGEMTRG